MKKITISDRIRAYGIGFIVSGIMQLLLVWHIPSLNYIGTTVIILQLTFYPIGIILIFLSKLKPKPETKIRKTWAEPLQKYFVMSIWSSLLTGISFHIIQNYEINTIRPEEMSLMLESIKSVLIGSAFFLSIIYAVFYYRRKWGNP